MAIDLSTLPYLLAYSHVFRQFEFKSFSVYVCSLLFLSFALFLFFNCCCCCCFHYSFFFFASVVTHLILHFHLNHSFEQTVSIAERAKAQYTFICKSEISHNSKQIHREQSQISTNRHAK